MDSSLLDTLIILFALKKDNVFAGKTLTFGRTRGVCVGGGGGGVDATPP